MSTFTDIVNNNLIQQYHTFSGAKTKASTPGGRMNSDAHDRFQVFQKDESVPYPELLAQA